MTAITIADLNNAKVDVDHIAKISTSTGATATDRLGNTKLTVKGAVDTIKAFNVRGAFAAATAYALKDIYTSGAIAYVTVVAHTSSSVAADLADGKVAIHQGATKEEVAEINSQLQNTFYNKRDKINLMTDIDFGQDVDDVGSLAVLHALADMGEVNIIAMANCFAQPEGAFAICAINTFYGRPEIPVGQTPRGIISQDNYLTAVARYPNHLTGTTPPTAVSVYRRAMASAPDNSVVWYVQSPMTNLYDVFHSVPDEISLLSGIDLMKKKLSKLVILGGIYPGGGNEYDFYSDPSSSQVINDLPADFPVIYHGFDCGANVKTSTTQPLWSPIKAGYEAFRISYGLSVRESWGALGILYCVRGLQYKGTTYFAMSASGTNHVAPDGTHVFYVGGGAYGNKGHSFFTQALDDASFTTLVNDFQNLLPKNGQYTSEGIRLHSPLNLNCDSKPQINFFLKDVYKGTIGVVDAVDPILYDATPGVIAFRNYAFRYQFGDYNTEVGFQIYTGYVDPLLSAKLGRKINLERAYTMEHFGVGISAPLSDEKLGVYTATGTAAQFKNDLAGNYTSVSFNTATSGDNQFYGFYTDAGILRGSIDYNRAGGATRYNTASDATIKNIIGDATQEKSLSILDSTRLRAFSWKDDPSAKPQIGVIAQELYETFKGAVSVGGNYEEVVDGETVTKYRPWAVDKTAFTFHLVAGYQHQQQQIADLTTRLVALESK